MKKKTYKIAVECLHKQDYINVATVFAVNFKDAISIMYAHHMDTYGSYPKRLRWIKEYDD